MAMSPTILAFLDYFTPGYKAGGPIRYMENLISQLKEDFSFRIVTRDRDVGDIKPYANVVTEEWVDRGSHAKIMYLPPGRLHWRAIKQILDQTEHDLLNINSVFSVPFSIQTFGLRFAGKIRGRPIVLAPRGELARSALAKSALRKRVYLSTARSLGLFDDVVWQASSDHEVIDIQRQFPGAQTVLAPEPMTTPGPSPSPRQKEKGNLRLVFISRLHRVKNLDYVLKSLMKVRTQVELRIFGPQEDHSYFEECNKLMDLLPQHVRATYCGSLHPTEVPGILREADLFILPTKGENFGHIIAEALCAGTPVLISDQTPWKDLESNMAGWALPLKDTGRFVATLDHVGDMDAAQHHIWAMGAWRYANQCGRDPNVSRANKLLFEKAIHQDRHSQRQGQPRDIDT